DVQARTKRFVGLCGRTVCLKDRLSIGAYRFQLCSYSSLILYLHKKLTPAVFHEKRLGRPCGHCYPGFWIDVYAEQTKGIQSLLDALDDTSIICFGRCFVYGSNGLRGKRCSQIVEGFDDTFRLSCQRLRGNLVCANKRKC